jgi:hypothetical protein
MTRLFVAGIAAGAAALAGATVTVARQNQPGLPTLAQVLVINRDRTEAVPVTVVGEPTVGVSPTAVIGTRAARQMWEYRRVVVPVANDPVPILNAAGLEGWEVTDGGVVGTNMTWTMKRAR